MTLEVDVGEAYPYYRILLKRGCYDEKNGVNYFPVPWNYRLNG